MNTCDFNTCLFLGRIWLEEASCRLTALLHLRDKLLADGPPAPDLLRSRPFLEHYALTATVMVRRFVRRIEAHVSKRDRLTLRRFLEATEVAERVRDAREHSDEYFLGKGRHQDAFVTRLGPIACDLSSALIDEEYVLGGIASVERLLSSVRAALAAFPSERVSSKEGDPAP